MITSLYLPQLNYLLDEFPEQHDFISRLDQLLYKQTEKIELSSDEIIAILQPVDFRSLIVILKSAEKTGLIDYCFQVSSHGKKIEQFKSILDIPEVMKDAETNEDFIVLLTDVTAVYKLNPPTLDIKYKPKM